MVIGIKWFHFIVSFLRDGPSFFRTTSAGKWLRAFGDPLSGLIFSQGSAAPVNPLLSLPFTAFSASHRGMGVTPTSTGKWFYFVDARRARAADHRGRC